MIHPVILCGGNGTRLWPLSRKAFPKQFIPLLNGKSLLQLTLERVAPLADGAQAITCVGAEEHRFLVADVARQCGLAVQQILEPEPRNTAAAIALACLAAPPDAVLLLCPADHHIPDAEAFAARMCAAVPVALAGNLVTFGVVPSFPSTAYGYIEQGLSLAGGGRAVVRFVEKPGLDAALDLLASGRYLWNAGILLARADVLRAALEQHAPDIFGVCGRAMATSRGDGHFLRPDADVFAGCRSESMDCAVLEKASNIAVFPFPGAWSDVGSWDAVSALAEPDAARNRAGGETRNAHHLHCTNMFIHAGGQRPVVALGVSDLFIIDTPDALLVAGEGQAEAVKQVVAQLRTLDATQAVHHRRVARPWGWYDSVDIGVRHHVKRITVRPGAALSLQMHHQRSEHWVVVSGVAEVTIGESVTLLHENQSTYIPPGCKHRLANAGAAPLEIIEVQSGAYLGEDDIVRFEDPAKA